MGWSRMTASILRGAGQSRLALSYLPCKSFLRLGLRRGLRHTSKAGRWWLNHLVLNHQPHPPPDLDRTLVMPSAALVGPSSTSSKTGHLNIWTSPHRPNRRTVSDSRFATPTLGLQTSAGRNNLDIPLVVKYLTYMTAQMAWGRRYLPPEALGDFRL